jgi:hypothetical protein
MSVFGTYPGGNYGGGIFGLNPSGKTILLF